MTDTMTSQNIDLSSWDTRYVHASYATLKKPLVTFIRSMLTILTIWEKPLQFITLSINARICYILHYKNGFICLCNSIIILFIYKPYNDGPYDRNIWWLKEAVKLIKPLIFVLISTDILIFNLLHCWLDGSSTSMCKLETVRWIWGSQSGDYEEDYFLGCEAGESCGNSPIFRRNVKPTSAFRWFIARFTLRPWRWRLYIPLKCRWSNKGVEKTV
jgi:hypothetical protein